jgi:hypothetical protein
VTTGLVNLHPAARSAGARAGVGRADLRPHDSMGCCSSAPAPLEEGVPPEGADLFAELGVSLLDRPLGNELKAVWYLSDRNHNDVLEAAELAAFFEAVSSKWGGSKWTRGANATSAVDVFLEAQQGSVDWQCVVAPHVAAVSVSTA